MLIYNSTDLLNKYLQEQALEAYEKEAISEGTYRKLKDSYPCQLNTPNLFIRFALALLTFVAVTFSGLLLGLFFGTSSGTTTLLIFFSIINYVSLELLVKQKKYYNAGVDNLLMLSAASLLTAAFGTTDYPMQGIVMTGIGFFVFLFVSLRYADAFMAIISTMCLYTCILLILFKMGTMVKAVVPFMMVCSSWVVYAAINSLEKGGRNIVYRNCCKWVKLLSLCTLYASVNYYVVKELSLEMFNGRSGPDIGLPFGQLFWALTFLVPIAYILYGTRKKNLLVARIGLILLAVSIITYRHYYEVMPTANALVLAGILLIIVSYVTIRLLHKPRFGFNFEKNNIARRGKIDFKALVISEATHQPTPAAGVTLGGGDFGGGGAGGKF